MARGPMLQSLLASGEAHRRFTDLGLDLPIGTTMVEQGFRATGLVMFESSQTVCSLPTFTRHAQLAVLILNFALLRKFDAALLGTDDKRLLSIFEQAFGRIRDSLGLGSTGVDSAVAIFRRCVASLQDAGDTDPSGPDEENKVLLPFSED